MGFPQGAETSTNVVISLLDMILYGSLHHKFDSTNSLLEQIWTTGMEIQISLKRK